MPSIKGKVAFVTGASRGLGRAYCQGLLDAGIGKLYAAARKPSDVDRSDARVVLIPLDVTDATQIRQAAKNCRDVDLLINNAGVLRSSAILAGGADEAARAEMAVNYFAVLDMVAAFAPHLVRNGGGAIVNVLSVASWFGNPFMATYCASKAATMALTNALRVELRAQAVAVVGVYAGYLDTDMAADIDAPKTPPMQVVKRTIEALEQGAEQVLADDRAVEIEALVRTDPVRLYANFQRRWDAR